MRRPCSRESKLEILCTWGSFGTPDVCDEAVFARNDLAGGRGCATFPSTHLEHRSKFWNTIELGPLLVKRLRADSKKQHAAIPKIRQSSRRRPSQTGTTTP